MFLKRTLVAGAFVVATAFAATAADIPAAPPAPPPAPPAAPAFSFDGGYFGAHGGALVGNPGLPPGTIPIRLGLQGGYNITFGKILAGIELSAITIAVPGFFGPGFGDAYGLAVTGRIGFLVGERLVVYGELGPGACFPGAGPCGAFVRLLAGGGVEFMVTPGISVFAEALGNFSLPLGGPFRGTLVTVGVNLH